MSPDDLYEEFVRDFRRRKFAAGVLVAFIDFWRYLGVPGRGLSNLAAVLGEFPQVTSLPNGGEANTLIVREPSGSTKSLRPFYDEVERYFRAEQKRFDYPSCAPHATQSWGGYRKWLDALTTYSDEEATRLRAKVVAFVLNTLKDQDFDPASLVYEPPLFRRVLESFDLTVHKGEKNGAIYQGIVFGFLRADNPHLQIEIDKVHVGSKRLQRVGDIDGWEGARLAISAEVKQYTIKVDGFTEFEDFSNRTGRRGTLGIVAALGFEEGAREQVEGLGLRALDLDDLLRIVELWDPVKQRTAVTSVIYYATHVEKNSALTDRLAAFLESEQARLPDTETGSGPRM